MKKYKEMFAGVVIVAAGKGTRMNMDINKQYVEVAGKPVLVRTLEAFQNCEVINEIILVVNEQDIIYCKQDIIEKFGFSKVKSIVSGGTERQYSVYNGLKEISNSSEIVLIHDGARPFIRNEDIINSIDAAYEFGAAGVAVPVKDTIKICDSEGMIKETPDRKLMWAIQTPQAFKSPIIVEAYKKAIEDGFIGTDDCMLVERLGHKVKLVMGSYENIKITTKEDLVVAEAIIDQRE
jgi:2-C-methyl-D-erythritol 4-phosphate cytidylyltransferase